MNLKNCDNRKKNSECTNLFVNEPVCEYFYHGYCAFLKKKKNKKVYVIYDGYNFIGVTNKRKKVKKIIKNYLEKQGQKITKVERCNSYGNYAAYDENGFNNDNFIVHKAKIK